MPGMEQRKTLVQIPLHSDKVSLASWVQYDSCTHSALRCTHWCLTSLMSSVEESVQPGHSAVRVLLLSGWWDPRSGCCRVLLWIHSSQATIDSCCVPLQSKESRIKWAICHWRSNAPAVAPLACATCPCIAAMTSSATIEVLRACCRRSSVSLRRERTWTTSAWDMAHDACGQTPHPRFGHPTKSLAKKINRVAQTGPNPVNMSHVAIHTTL